MVFAPIDVWPTGLAGADDHAVGLDLVEDFADFVDVLHSHGRGVDVFALLQHEVFELVGDPSSFAPDEVAEVAGGVGGHHDGLVCVGDGGHGGSVKV